MGFTKEAHLIEKLTKMTQNGTLKWTNGGGDCYLAEYSDMVIQLFVDTPNNFVVTVNGNLEITDSDVGFTGSSNGSLLCLKDAIQSQTNIQIAPLSDRQRDLDDIMKRLDRP